MPFALIDPNYGEPKPVLGTIRDTEDGAWAAAVHPKADPTARLYSGASVHPFPSGTPGTIERLVARGFTVAEVQVSIKEGRADG